MSRKCAIIADPLNDSNHRTKAKLHFCVNNDTASSSSDTSATISDSRMVIQPDGNVGIGTTSPDQKLDVKTSTAYDGIFLRNSTDAIIGKIAVDSANNNAGYLALYNGTGGNGTIFRGNGYSYFMGGNVGIGMNVPGDKLTIKTSASSQGITIQENSNGNTIFKVHDTGAGAAAYFYKETGNNLTKIAASGNSFLLGGNVGIGTTSPSARLDVSGNLKVQNGYLDLSGGGIVMHHQSSEGPARYFIGYDEDNRHNLIIDPVFHQDRNFGPNQTSFPNFTDTSGTVIIHGHLQVMGDMVYEHLINMDISNAIINIDTNATTEDQLTNTGLIWGGSAIIDRPFILYHRGTPTSEDDVGHEDLNTDDIEGFYINRKILTTAIDVKGQLDVDGDATFNGNVTLGNANTDTITFTGKANSILDMDDNNIITTGNVGINTGIGSPAVFYATGDYRNRLRNGPITKLQVGPELHTMHWAHLGRVGKFDPDAVSIIHPSPTTQTSGSDPKPVLYLGRVGTINSQAGQFASFCISKYENVSRESAYHYATPSRTRLDIKLAHGGATHQTQHTNWAKGEDVMTLLSSGNVGIGTTSPNAKLQLSLIHN